MPSPPLAAAAAGEPRRRPGRLASGGRRHSVRQSTSTQAYLPRPPRIRRVRDQAIREVRLRRPNRAGHLPASWVVGVAVQPHGASHALPEGLPLTNGERLKRISQGLSLNVSQSSENLWPASPIAARRRTTAATSPVPSKAPRFRSHRSTVFASSMSARNAGCSRNAIPSSSASGVVSVTTTSSSSGPGGTTCIPPSVTMHGNDPSASVRPESMPAATIRTTLAGARSGSPRSWSASKTRTVGSRAAPVSASHQGRPAMSLRRLGLRWQGRRRPSDGRDLIHGQHPFQPLLLDGEVGDSHVAHLRDREASLATTTCRARSSRRVSNGHARPRTTMSQWTRILAPFATPLAAQRQTGRALR